MAIRPQLDPADEGLSGERVMWVESDAETNQAAIREIEAWCREHDLVRLQENWLRVIYRDNRMVRRGHCYRRGDDWHNTRRIQYGQIPASSATAPETIASVEILDQSAVGEG